MWCLYGVCSLSVCVHCVLQHPDRPTQASRQRSVRGGAQSNQAQPSVAARPSSPKVPTDVTPQTFLRHLFCTITTHPQGARETSVLVQRKPASSTRFQPRRTIRADPHSGLHIPPLPRKKYTNELRRYLLPRAATGEPICRARLCYKDSRYFFPRSSKRSSRYWGERKDERLYLSTSSQLFAKGKLCTSPSSEKSRDFFEFHKSYEGVARSVCSFLFKERLKDCSYEVSTSAVTYRLLLRHGEQRISRERPTIITDDDDDDDGDNGLIADLSQPHLVKLPPQRGTTAYLYRLRSRATNNLLSRCPLVALNIYRCVGSGHGKDTVAKTTPRSAAISSRRRSSTSVDALCWHQQQQRIIREPAALNHVTLHRKTPPDVVLRLPLVDGVGLGPAHHTLLCFRQSLRRVPVEERVAAVVPCVEALLETLVHRRSRYYTPSAYR